MLFKLIMITFLVFSLKANNSFDMNKNITINYLNINYFKLKDQRIRDRLALKEYVSESQFVIFNSLQDINSMDYLCAPARAFYINRFYYIDNPKTRAVLYQNDNTNEKHSVKIISYRDTSRIYKKDIISGYLIDKKYLIFTINFKKNKELKNNIRKLKDIVYWSKKELHVKITNIAFVGVFNLSFSKLKNKVPGFHPLLNNGTKFVKVNNKLKLAKVENVLVSDRSNISAKVNFLFRRELLNGKYKSKKNNKTYMKNISPYYPIEIKIKI